ncbi:MAG: hypothetical protein KC503_08705 [Myxococcales bacterium]|nr:hypothetical protein [Myxococcales bacterium]
MTRQQGNIRWSAWILGLAGAALVLSGCGLGEVGGKAIDLLGQGSDGVLPVRQSSSCGCGGGGGTYPGYPGYPSDPNNPYPSDPNNPYPSDPNNPQTPSTPPPSTPSTPQTPAPGSPGNPGPTGNYGAVCQQASDCTSGPCVRGPDGAAFCTAQCTPTSSICPAEAGCHATSVANMYVCGKPATSGGGSTTPPPSTTPQPDQAAPVVYITSPLTGSSVPSQVRVTANISDNVGLKIVELYVDGTLASSTSAGPWEFPLTLQPGKHLLTLRAIDTSGNSTDAQATVTVAAGNDPGSSLPGSPTAPGGTVPAGNLQYGQSCGQPGDCSSGMCANDVTLGLQYCSQTCVPGANACPAGSGCYAANAGVYVCAVEGSSQGQQQGQAPGADGMSTQGAASCSVGASPAGTAPAALVLLGLALLGAVRRRRRRRR